MQVADDPYSEIVLLVHHTRCIASLPCPFPDLPIPCIGQVVYLVDHTPGLVEGNLHEVVVDADDDDVGGLSGASVSP